MPFRKEAVLKALKYTGVLTACHWLTRKRLRVLCFHGFSPPGSDLHHFEESLFVSTQNFERIAALLADWQSRQRLQLMPLDEAIRTFEKNACHHHGAVTFDDGWQSFFSIALPILKKNRLPATVYQTTHYAQNNSPVWNVALRYLLWKTTLQTFVCPQGKSYDLSHPHRISALHQLGRELSALPGLAEKIEFFKKLAAILNLDTKIVLAERWFSLMNADEIRQAQAQGVDFQLHTHRHRFPPRKEVAIQEIQDNRRALGALLPELNPSQFRHFCYPSGHYEYRQIPWLKEAGIHSAATMQSGINGKQERLFRLCRIVIRDNMSDLELEAQLSGAIPLLKELRARLLRPS